MAEALRVEGLRKSYGLLEVLKGIDLVVERGQTVVLLGASGSGKSTLLRCMNFLEASNAGRIILHGEVVGTPVGTMGAMRYSEPALCRVRSRIGMVFQQFNLFPHMTALQNVMEGQVTVLRRPKALAQERTGAAR